MEYKDLKVKQCDGYENNVVEIEDIKAQKKKKTHKKHNFDIMDMIMLPVAIGIIVGVGFLIAGLI